LLDWRGSIYQTWRTQSKLRTLSALVIALLLTLSAAAQDTVRGAFTKVSGSVEYDAANVGKSSIQVTIEAASVDTRVEMRDNDIRSASLLDAQKYPTITFQSKKVEAAGAGKLKVSGDLTIHGVTKEVVLDVDGPTPAIKDPMGPGQRMGASATTKINRNDFGVSGRAGVVGDDISITIDIEMTRPATK
jgi:polyisoprenoid-binding protein YceI